MTPERHRLAKSKMYYECPCVFISPVGRRLPSEVVTRRRIFVVMIRARSQNIQQASIAAFCEVNRVIPIEACHAVMVGNPKRSTRTLVPQDRTHG